MPLNTGLRTALQSLASGVTLLLLPAGGGRTLAGVSGNPLPVDPLVGGLLALAAGILALAVHRVRGGAAWLALGGTLPVAGLVHALGSAPAAASVLALGLGLGAFADRLSALSGQARRRACVLLASVLLAVLGALITSGPTSTAHPPAGGAAVPAWLALAGFVWSLWVRTSHRDSARPFARGWLVQAALWGATGPVLVLVGRGTGLASGPWLTLTQDVAYTLLALAAWRTLSGRPRPRAEEQAVVDAIARIHGGWRAGRDAERLFRNVLEELIRISGSEYGFLGEVTHDAQGHASYALRSAGELHATRDRRVLFRTQPVERMEVDDPDTPVGAVVARGEPVLCNRRDATARARGLPPGHPPVRSLLVLPARCAGTVNAVIGLANRPQGYGAEVIDMLRPLADTCGAVLGAQRDGEGRRAAEHAVRTNLASMEASIDGMAIVDGDGTYIYVNRAFHELYGYDKPERVLGRRWDLLYGQSELERFHREVIPQFMKCQRWRGECAGTRADGTHFPLELSLTAVRDGGMICVARDITERKLAEGQIHYLAHYDSLTGLPNRRLLQERLGQALVQTRRAGRMLAVLFLDLDRFKPINDSLGHEAGDELLKAIATRLTDAVRESDVVARLGGDEFIVVLTNLGREQDAVVVAEKLREVVCRPVDLRSSEVAVSTSIGISMYPGDGTEIDVLMRKADDAMYRSKAHGRDGYAFHGQATHARVSERLHMERLLSRALERGELVLHYQPLADLHTGGIVGMEALLRWDSPELGMVDPSNFVPFAEEAGLIVPIGEWVLQEACAQARKVRDAGLGALQVTVNFSARQLREPDVAEMIQGTLERFALEPAALVVDINEHDLTQRPDPDLAHTLRGLAALGISVAVDDYGAAGCSVLHLKRFPIHALKIHASCVQELPHDGDTAQLVAAIIAMARELNLRVIAEGVEHGEQVAFLRERGCHAIQGFLVSAPVAGAELLAVLRRSRHLLEPSQAG